MGLFDGPDAVIGPKRIEIVTCVRAGSVQHSLALTASGGRVLGDGGMDGGAGEEDEIVVLEVWGVGEWPVRNGVDRLVLAHADAEHGGRP